MTENETHGGQAGAGPQDELTGRARPGQPAPELVMPRAGHHRGHPGGHGGHVGRFRRLFWAMLLLAVPVVVLSPMFAMLVGYDVPAGGLVAWTPPVLQPDAMPVDTRLARQGVFHPNGQHVPSCGADLFSGQHPAVQPGGGGDAAEVDLADAGAERGLHRRRPQ